MTKEEWIKIYNAKDGTWDKDDLIDKAYEIISSPIKANYDRIKSMSVEEMAEFICSIYDDNQEPYTADKNIEGYTIPDYDESNIKEWLEKEVK